MRSNKRTVSYKRSNSSSDNDHATYSTTKAMKKSALSSLLPGSIICMSLIQLQTSEAFSPGCESILNKNNKKCHGVACPRRSSSSNMCSSKKHTRGGAGIGGSGVQNKNSPQHLYDENIYGSNQFALRMASYEHEQELIHQEAQRQQQIHSEQQSAIDDDDSLSSTSTDDFSHESMTQERRLFLASLFATTTTATTTSFASAANAFEKAYPVNLDFDNDDTSINLQSIRQERIAVQKSQAKQVKADLVSKPYVLGKKELIGSVVWGGALWLLLGSRSNPLVKPLANLLYDENTEEGAWVKDRNEGLFAPLPLAFTLIMGLVFLVLGFITDRGLLFLAEGQSTVVLQLAGVSLIGGASLELGRIASGEKMLTREDLNRKVMLADEFNEFASKRLVVGEGGAVHRSEVIKAFRRYFAKYRVENDQYPLTDLEIERLLRTWNKIEGNPEGLTSAGFLKGVKINEQAIIQ